MRALEILLLVALLPAVAGSFVARARRPRWLALSAFAPIVVAVAQIAIEGYRWQMVPAYALALLFLASALAGRRSAPVPDDAPRSRGRVALRIAGATVGAFGWLAAMALPALFPVFRMPRPTGAHAIGFTRFALVDSSRSESFSADPTDKRALVVEAWYPAESATGERTVFWGPRMILPRLGPALGMPSFMFEHLAHVRTHSRVDAPVLASPAQHPVLVFSHGFNQGFAGQNTVQMEELASHGYAVFSIGHPYESLAIAFPDGRIVPVSKSRMDSVGRAMGASGRALRAFAASNDRAERAKHFREAISEPRLLHESLAVWTQDTRFVIDELTRLTAVDGRGAATNVPFRGRLDLSRLGVFGMSFGGTTAGQVCVVEPRCKAGVNLDGTQYGDPIDTPLRVPFMFMSGFFPTLHEPVYERAAGPAYSVNIKGASHFNYTDFSLISPLFKRMGFLGPIDGTRMERIMSDYLLAFFDTHLKGERGQRSALLDPSSSIYPEVQLSARIP